MKTIATTLLTRDDLKPEYRNVEQINLNWNMFIISDSGIMINDDLVIFVDNNGKTIIFKNRYGAAENR